LQRLQHHDGDALLLQISGDAALVAAGGLDATRRTPIRASRAARPFQPARSLLQGRVDDDRTVEGIERLDQRLGKPAPQIAGPSARNSRWRRAPSPVVACSDHWNGMV
jgi:hypothetical protein